MRSAAVLIALVQEIVDDADVTETAILAWMNEALNLVAERITPTTLMVPFSPLDIYAGEPSVALPEGCIPEKILSIHDVDRKPVRLYFRIADAEESFRTAPAEDTSLRAVLVMGNAMRLIPQLSKDSVLYLSYIRYPTVFTGPTDTGEEVNFIPSGMAEKLVVNYAVAMAYRLIEDGVTDSRLNFKTYLGAAQEALMEINMYFAPKSKQAAPEFITGDDFDGRPSASSLLLVTGGL